MSKLSIDFLINSPREKLVKNIDSIFNKVVQKIELYLDLEPIDKAIKVSLINGKSSDSELQANFFSIGAHRFYENNVLNIRISCDYARFIPIIALREAYKCFVPKMDVHVEMIDIFINQKVAIDLKKLASLKEWFFLPAYLFCNPSEHSLPQLRKMTPTNKLQLHSSET